MQKVYAEALMRARSRGENEETLVSNLVKHLKEKGRLKLLPGILSELKDREVRAKKLSPVLEIAEESGRDTAIAQAKAEGIEVGTVVVNARLIKGWRARSGATLLDRSGKRALVDIYKNIVTK